jgi:predicted metal-dependent HD superfamily phosphohydrolase
MSPSPLHDRWNSLCERVGAFKSAHESDVALEMLSTLYANPPRKYHNLDHIGQVLGMFDSARMLADEKDAVEFAIWLHDCVYFAERPDNEERSADAAGMIAGLLGCGAEFLALVRSCIMATRHSAAPEKGDASLVADLDLTILGATREEYDRYAAAIREEFAFAPDEQYVPGRIAFLQRMVDKERIFHTPHFFARMERGARENLYREMDRLEKARKG